MSILPSISDLPTGKRLFSGLLGETYKMIVKPTKDKKDSTQKFTVIAFMLLAMICVIATEPLKVIFRKRIGEEALDIGGVIAGCTLYFGWGVLMFGLSILGTAYYYMPTPNIPFHSYIFMTIGIAYFILAFYILNAAMNEKYRAKAEASLDYNTLHYRGDSILMEKYRKKGWSKEMIWYKAEPRAAFIVGFITTIPFFPIGLPILLTSICFWINEWYHCKYVPDEQKREMRRRQVESLVGNDYQDKSSIRYVR